MKHTPCSAESVEGRHENFIWWSDKEKSRFLIHVLTTEPAITIISPYATISGSNLEKLTSFPINANEIGFTNFHNKLSLSCTSFCGEFLFVRINYCHVLSVNRKCNGYPIELTFPLAAQFRLFQRSPHIQAIMMHPRAPADGYPITLLPSTDKRPPNTIMVKRRPFEYFYTNTVKLKNNVWANVDYVWTGHCLVLCLNSKYLPIFSMAEFCPQINHTRIHTPCRLQCWSVPVTAAPLSFL